MKSLRPGNICTINSVRYRAKKRINFKCTGCALDRIDLCPNVVDSRNGHKVLSCKEDDIILVKET